MKHRALATTLAAAATGTLLFGLAPLAGAQTGLNCSDFPTPVTAGVGASTRSPSDPACEGNPHGDGTLSRPPSPPATPTQGRPQFTG